MPRPSRLLFQRESSHEGAEPPEPEVVSTSEEGLPLGWVFCFGGRNYHDPEDVIVARYGTAAARDPLATPIDVAEARLGNAITVLEENEHLWPWFASLTLLRQRLAARSGRGVLRIEAPWLESTSAEYKAIGSLGENYVNCTTASRLDPLPRLARELGRVCPFVPACQPGDLKAFHKVAGKKAGAVDAAERIVGLPGYKPERFAEIAEKHCAPAFALLGNLPPYPKPQTSAQAGAGGANAKGARGADSSEKADRVEGGRKPSGFLNRLKGLVGRR